MIKKAEDYVDLSFEAIQANIQHYRSKIDEVEQLLDETKKEKLFWIKVRNLKQKSFNIYDHVI